MQKAFLRLAVDKARDRKLAQPLATIDSSLITTEIKKGKSHAESN